MKSPKNKFALIWKKKHLLNGNYFSFHQNYTKIHNFGYELIAEIRVEYFPDLATGIGKSSIKLKNFT